MAKKKFSATPAKKKPSRRLARSPPVKPTLRAHPRLIHGFLIRLAKRSPIAAGRADPGFTARASDKARAGLTPDAKHEGPADDATFH